MAKEDKKTLQNLLESVWGIRDAGLDLAPDQNIGPWRPVGEEDIDYFCNFVYPYLHIMNSQATFETEFELKFNILKNKWVIYDYGEVMSSSLPHSYFGIKNKDKVKKDEIESGEGGDSGGGFGTIVAQQFDTAFEMMKEAQTKGWAAVEIINGTKLMQYFAWIAAQELNLAVKGFSPTEQQKKHYNSIKKDLRKKIVEEFTSESALTLD